MKLIIGLSLLLLNDPFGKENELKSTLIIVSL